MSNEEKKDVFLNAIAGTTPIKKSNRNYKLIPRNEVKQIKINKKNLEIKLHTPKEKKEYQEEEIHTRFRLQKSTINKKLKKGMINIDKKIDFHGLTVEEAKLKFFETIESCFISNKRCILFVTGKGSRAPQQNRHEEKRLYYGKIRNEFLDWAHQKTISRKILSAEQAGISHGGDGAFLVYLRKKN